MRKAFLLVKSINYGLLNAYSFSLKLFETLMLSQSAHDAWTTFLGDVLFFLYALSNLTSSA